MPDCFACGGAIVNGARVARTDDRGWTLVSGTRGRYACRGCAKALVHGDPEDLEAVDQRVLEAN